MQRYEKFLKNVDAAEILGVAPSTLKQSRHTGQLFGRPAPPFLRCGRNIRYKFSALASFSDQFAEYQNTSQINEKTR